MTVPDTRVPPRHPAAPGARRSAADRYLSPLRYPGGKAKWGPWLADLFACQSTRLDVEIWLEPFAGGAGAALSAVALHDVPEAWLVESNPALAAFWRAVIARGDTLADRVEHATPTLSLLDDAAAAVTDSQWIRDVDELPDGDVDELAFAAFVVNRCSRSGLIAPRAGALGGRRQTGPTTVTSRWNGPALAARIRRLHQLAPALQIDHGDGITRLEELPDSGIADEVFCFIDPPYIGMGDRLYTHGMPRGGHQRLADALHRLDAPWVLTYDAHPDVLALYPHHAILQIDTPTTCGPRRVGSEYVVLGHRLGLPCPPEKLPHPHGAGRIRWVEDSPSQVADMRLW